MLLFWAHCLGTYISAYKIAFVLNFPPQLYLINITSQVSFHCNLIIKGNKIFVLHFLQLHLPVPFFFFFNLALFPD